MAYWLFKSEPTCWSWQQQKEKAPETEEWSGVRNYLARNHMCTMKKGEKGFFYHSIKGLNIVGIVEIAANAHPDSTSADLRWQCVDVRAVCDLPKPVSLKEIKQNPKLQNTALIKYSRLSVQPVTEQEWQEICIMGGLDPDKI